MWSVPNCSTADDLRAKQAASFDICAVVAKQAASSDACAVVTVATAIHVRHHPFMKVCVLAAGWRHRSTGITHDVHL